VRYARDFASGRRVISHESARMNRLYVAEPTPTITGANADHRLPIAARDIEAIAKAIARELGIETAVAAPVASADSWIRAVVDDIRANRGASVIVAGDAQPRAVHALVRQINNVFGNAFTAKSNAVVSGDSLPGLIADINSSAVELLLILGGNPVYDSPVDFEFARSLEKIKLRIHHTLHANETSRLCHWIIPAAHFLETWSDARAYDGSVTIMQPLIEPLYAGRSVHEMLEALISQPVRDPYEIVHQRWLATNRAGDFEIKWRRALSKGVIENLEVARRAAVVARPAESTGAVTDRNDEPDLLEILFRPDANLLDGRYANNGWLQELPRPFTKLTWDNAALVSPKLAVREKLENGDVVELSFRGRKIDAPVWIQPGQAENSVTLHLGYGRTDAGRVGHNVGFNAYKLRTSDALWFGDGLTLRKTGKTYRFATTQFHHSVEGRDILRAGTLSEFIARSGLPHEKEPEPNETLLNPNEFANSGYAWAMVIDLNTCIGCGACTIACQAENNIPVVGKDQVARGREMHWIRVDTYHAGSPNEPEFSHQPVPCMHCEHAPCELVCPVAATVHDAEGLNLQVYNRCVGTRYCSNNCPYKVRRFNFFELNAALSPTEKLLKNPDVTVRSRGVMEKCTYCLQRINAVRISAELEQRTIRDGEIIPACAQVCPTEAIVFGSIHDPNSRVSRLRKSPLNYSMLAELNTRPRTTYLAKLRNPNPDLA
jgi:Fe-S-cluster-containing dehydrogenase component